MMACLLFVAVSCSDGAADDVSSDAARRSTTTAIDLDAAATHLESDAALIEEYISAINSNDVDTAMSLRCVGARLDEAELPVAGDQIRRLIDASGPTEVLSIEEAIIDAEPLDNGDDVATYRVALANDAPESDGVVILAVVDQDGERRLCGVLTEWRALLPDEQEPTLVDLGATKVGLEAIVPDVEIPGMTVIEAGPLPEGETAPGWGRTWQAGDYGGCRAFAQSGSVASEAVEHFVERALSDGVEMWEVPGEPGILGVRILGYAWLWTQPPGSGPFTDYAFARMGNTLIGASCANLSADADHSMTSDLVHAALDNARG